MVALVPIADLTGPAGHDSTTLDGNAAVLGDLVNGIPDSLNAFKAALDLNYASAKEGGIWAHKENIKIDGTGDNSVAFSALVDKCDTFGLKMLVGGPIRLESNFATTKNVRIKGMTANAALVLVSSSNSISFAVIPDKFAIGNVAAAAVGDTTVTMQTGGQPSHAGKWIEILDPTINPDSLDPTLQRRRILANTATIAMLRSPLGYAVPDGMAASVVTPIDQVSIEDITIDSTGSTGDGAGVSFTYIKDLYLSKVKVKDPGDFAAVKGNGMAIYQCDKVRTHNIEVSNAGNFGIFTYNCDNVRHIDPVVSAFAGQFGMQLKDNRDAKIIRGRVLGEGNRIETVTTTNGSTTATVASTFKAMDVNRTISGANFHATLKTTITAYDSVAGTITLSRAAIGTGAADAKLDGKGDTAFNIKCSGQNDARTQHLIGCYAEKSRKADYEFSTIQNEGTGFIGKDFLAQSCTSYLSNATGFSTIVDALTADVLKDWRWNDNEVDGAGQVAYVPSSGMQGTGNRALNCAFEAFSYGGITVKTGTDETAYFPVHDISMEGSVINNCCTSHTTGSLSRSAPVLVSNGVTGVRMRNTRSYRTKATDSTQRLIREVTAVAASGTAGVDLVLAKPIPDFNEFDGWINVDQAAANALSQDALLYGPNSRMIGTYKLDKFIGTPIINKWRDYEWIKATDSSLAAGVKVLAVDTDGAFIGTLPAGTFEGTLELGYNSSTTGDFQWDLFGGSMVATGYVQGSAPAVNATASVNVANSSYQRVAHGTAVIMGGTAADEWTTWRVRLVVTTAGTIQLRYALNATDAAGIPKVLLGSRLVLSRKG